MHRIDRRHAYPVIILTFLLQLLISNFLTSASLKPNLMLIITVFFALFSNARFGAETGFLSGLLLDIFSIRLFGLNAILYAAGGYIIGKNNNKFYKDSAMTHIILTFGVSFFILWTYFAVVSVRNSPLSFGTGMKSVFSPSILSVSAINAFLGIWVYAFLIKVLGISEAEV